MKKIFAMLLVAVMCFSLAACGGNEPQTGNSGSQQEQSDNKNDKEINIKKVDVVGTWKNTSSNDHGFVMTINEDGTGTIILGEQELTITWKKTDEEIICNTAFKELTFKIQANNGVVEMSYKDGYYVVVSEQDYENTIECVELTLENWQQYFEIKPYAEPQTDAFDELSDLMICTTLVLKDEYANTFAGSDGAIEVSFGGAYRCPIEYNSATKELTLGTPYTKEENEQQGYYLSTEAITYTNELTYYREYGFAIGGGVGCNPDTFKVEGDIATADASYYETIEITRIQGHLYFKK